MATYRFIGFESVIHRNGFDVSLSQFGQKVELSDEEARLDVGNRVPLLSEAEFKSLGLTDAEVEAFQTRGVSSAAFAVKRQKAAELFVAKMVALFAPAATAPEQNPAPIAPHTETPAVSEGAKEEDHN